MENVGEKKRALIVSDISPLMGDPGVFASGLGYESYYGPVSTAEITRELLTQLSDTDILWLAVDNLDMPVSLSEHKDPAYGDRRVWIVRPASSATLPRDIIQYQIIPSLDIQSLMEFARTSKTMSQLVEEEIYHRAQRRGEITREEFHRLGAQGDKKSNPGRAYGIWVTYRNVLSLGRRMVEGESLEEIRLLTRYIAEIMLHIESLSPRQLEELLPVVEEYGGDYNYNLILARLLSFFSDEEVMDLWKLSFLDEEEQIAGIRELKFTPAIKSVVARNSTIFTSRQQLLTAILLGERDNLLRELEFDEFDGEMVDQVIRFVVVHSPLDEQIRKNLRYLEGIIGENQSPSSPG